MNYKQILLIFLVLSFLWQTSRVYADNPKQDFRKGTRYLQQNNFDGAIDSFSSAFKALFDIMDRNEEQDKLLADTLNNRGIAYMEKARAGGRQNRYYDLAEKDFKDAQSLFPDDAKAGNNLGLLYYELGRYEDSINAYEEALALIPQGAPFKPYHADAFSNLAICYAKIEPPNTEKALENFTRAIEITKSSSARDWTMLRTRAYYNRGNLYYNLNQYDEAIADYSETINLFEKAGGTKSKIFENAYYNRGLCYYHQGKYQEAINDYTKAIELNPGYMWAHYAKGFAHYMLGQDNLAEDSYRNVIAPAETNLSTDERAHAKFGYGLIYVRKKAAGQNHFEQGMTYLKEACNSGRCEIACQALEKGLSVDPDTILLFDRPK